MYVCREHLCSRGKPYSYSLRPVHTSNIVEATFDIVERVVQLVAFDNVASTLLLVSTGLKTVQERT